MSWHVTWQDPVALALVVLVIVAVRWARKRLEPAGCASCEHTESGAKARKPTRVALDALRIGRQRK